MLLGLALPQSECYEAAGSGHMEHVGPEVLAPGTLDWHIPVGEGFRLILTSAGEGTEQEERNSLFKVTVVAEAQLMELPVLSPL